MWKKVEGFDPEIWVSDSGEVVQKLPQYTDNSGYMQVVIKKRKHFVHRLVGRAFLDKDYHRCQINHRNGIKDDNRLENLEWCTPAENVQHYFSVLKTRGISNYRLKLWQQIAEHFNLSPNIQDHLPPLGRV